jgi:hypothetical protein
LGAAGAGSAVLYPLFLMTDVTDLLRLNDRVYLLVRNPSSVLVCWTWSGSAAGAFESGVYEPEIIVRLAAAEDKNLMVECSARWNAGKLYIRPPAEGRVYAASVYALKKGGAKDKLMESNAALTPVSSAMSGLSAGYASAEFFRQGSKEPV